MPGRRGTGESPLGTRARFALSEMERLGYNVQEIQKAAAHAAITTTKGYSTSTATA